MICHAGGRGPKRTARKQKTKNPRLSATRRRPILRRYSRSVAVGAIWAEYHVPNQPPAAPPTVPTNPPSVLVGPAAARVLTAPHDDVAVAAFATIPSPSKQVTP